MDASGADNRGTRADARFAWVSVLFAAWLIGSLVLIVWALGHDLTDDVGISPYHIPFYAAVLALSAASVVLVRRAIRAGRRWHDAFPAGYGSLGAGLVLLLAWPIVDTGWREGIGLPDSGIETIVAPSRLLLAIGAVLVAAAPLRAAMRAPGGGVARWPAVLSAGFVAVLLGGVGGYQPAQAPWLENARHEPRQNLEIWVMDADGGGQTRLIEAADGWEPVMPVWSPDGTQIAFTRMRTPERTGIPADDQDVWLASADGTEQRLLVGGAGWQWLPKWSPDGTWITYTIDGPGGPGEGAGLRAPFFGFGQGPAFGQPPDVSPDVDVWRIRADGTGEPERLTDDPADDRAGAYSPDGRHLLFDSTRADGRPAIYAADADGANPVRLTFLGDDWGATWSPDGTRIAFHAYPGGGAEDIYVLGFPDGALVRLTSDPGNDTRPSWSPDGSRIAFTVARGNEPEVWSMAADGTDQRNLSRSPGVATSLAAGGGAWGPDGRILYERTAGPSAAGSPIAREDLGVAAVLLEVILLVVVVLVVVRLGPPFGAVAVIMGLGAAFAAIDGDDWRFLPAAIVGGLVVDVLVRLAPAARRPHVAGAGTAIAYVLGAGITVIVTAGMGWSPSLLLGVTVASAAIAVGLAGLIGRPAAAAAVPPSGG